MFKALGTMITRGHAWIWLVAASYFAFNGIFIGFAAGFLYVSPTNTHNLVFSGAVFATFLGMILLFSVIYYSIFLASPSSFWFAETIVRERRATGLAEAQKEIDLWNRARDVLERVQDALRGEPDADIFVNKWEKTVDLGSVKYETGRKHVGRRAHFVALVSVYQSQDRIFSWEPKDPKRSYTIGKLREDIPNEIEYIDERLSDDLKRRSVFAGSSPEIWNFADFVYFSVIIQSTVGLGDIQPNSTTVRKVVIGQVLIGYAILIVLLNVVLGWEFSPGP